MRERFPIWLRPLPAALLPALAACGSAIDGTYESPNGFMSIEFDGDRAYVSMPMGTTEATYEVDGDRVVLRHPSGNVVLTRLRDGSLDGPLGTLKKK